MKTQNNKLAIFQTQSGALDIKIDNPKDTVWLRQLDIVALHSSQWQYLPYAPTPIQTQPRSTQ